MALSEIPLSPGNQRFKVTLNGIAYQLSLIWRNSSTGGWYLDIGRPDGTPLVMGIPLTLGASIIEQYQHKITGQIFVITSDGQNPTFAGLASTTKLYWVDP
jgi:hypothetical protein